MNDTHANLPTLLGESLRKMKVTPGWPQPKSVYEARAREALSRGSIRAIGGLIYDCDMNFLMNNSDLAKVARDIGIVRTDSGGSPTWTLA